MTPADLLEAQHGSHANISTSIGGPRTHDRACRGTTLLTIRPLRPALPNEERKHRARLILIFTDRVRSKREGYVLTPVCPSVCLSTGGVPHLARRGGVPQPGPAKGYCKGWGTPLPGMGYPPPGQDCRWEYLIRGGRYASCVHAGGLSCSDTCFRRWIHNSPQNFSKQLKIKNILVRIGDGRPGCSHDPLPLFWMLSYTSQKIKMPWIS